MLVRAAPPEHFEWLIARAGCAVTSGLRAIEAVDAKGRIHGMIGYDLWTPNSVQLHQAVETPIAWRSLIKPGFEYPFIQCGKGLLLGLTPSSNERALAMNRRLGFRETHRVKDACAVGEDLVVFEMRKEECRWLSKELPNG